MFGKVFHKRSLSKEQLNTIFKDIDETIYNNSGNANYIYDNCINELCNQVAKIPINLYKIDKNSKEIYDNNLNTLLSLRPNPYQTSFSLIHSVMYNVFKNGIGAIYIKRDRKGQIIALYSVNNLSINYNINVFNDEKKLNYTGEIFNYSSTFLEDELCIIRDREDILQNRAKNNISDLLEANNKQIKLLDKIFSGENLADNLVLQQKTDSEVFKDSDNVAKIINIYLNLLKNNGLSNEKIKTIPLGWELKTLNTKLTDNQFLEIKQDTGNEIRKALGLFINSSDEEELNFLQNTITPLIYKIQLELNYKLLTENQRRNGLKIEFNLADFIMISQEKHVQILKELVTSGIYTINEARESVNKNHIDDGDSVLINSGVYKLDMLDNILKPKIEKKIKSAENSDDEDKTK